MAQTSPSTITVLLPNSLLFVRDCKQFDIPMFEGPEAVTSTSTCVLLVTQAVVDGATRLKLATTETDHEEILVFDQNLTFPTRCISLSNVNHEDLLTADLASERCRVQIWVDERINPSSVVVVVTDVETS